MKLFRCQIMYLARKTLGDKMVLSLEVFFFIINLNSWTFWQRNFLFTKTFGDVVYMMKPVSSLKVISNKNRTFIDENFRLQKYIWF